MPLSNCLLKEMPKKKASVAGRNVYGILVVYPQSSKWEPEDGSPPRTDNAVEAVLGVLASSKRSSKGAFEVTGRTSSPAEDN